MVRTGLPPGEANRDDRFRQNKLDTTASLHHGATMRLTISLDDDLYAMARAHAIAKRMSLSKAVGDLLRRRLAGDGSGPSSGPDAGFHIDPETLLPVVPGRGEAITNEDVRLAAEDDDARYLSQFPTLSDTSPL